MKCKQIKSDGAKCKANAMLNSDYCFRHNKSTKKQALKASSTGGKSKRQFYNFGKALKLKKPKDIKNLMEKAINKLWTGELPASNPAGALGYLSKIFLEAYDKSEIELRVKELEDKVNKIKV